MGCHFDELGAPNWTKEYFFLVNGTSQHTLVQFVDFPRFQANHMGEMISRRAVRGASRVPRRVALCTGTAWGWHAGAGARANADMSLG